MTWTCPRCDRTFGAKRAHVCSPGLPVDYALSELPESQRRAAEAVLALARRLKGLVVEAVGVGIFIKRERTIIELRPKTRWLQLSFVTTAAVASPRISRTIALRSSTAYFVRLRDAADVDAELRRWLLQALRSARATS